MKLKSLSNRAKNVSLQEGRTQSIGRDDFGLPNEKRIAKKHLNISIPSFEPGNPIYDNIFVEFVILFPFSNHYFTNFHLIINY